VVDQLLCHQTLIGGEVGGQGRHCEAIGKHHRANVQRLQQGLQSKGRSP
jgi:hypothetical protein